MAGILCWHFKTKVCDISKEGRGWNTTLRLLVFFFFPLDVISKHSYWYLKALFLFYIVLHMFMLLSREKVEPIEFTVQKLYRLPAITGQVLAFPIL